MPVETGGPCPLLLWLASRTEQLLDETSGIYHAGEGAEQATQIGRWPHRRGRRAAHTPCHCICFLFTSTATQNMRRHHYQILHHQCAFSHAPADAASCTVASRGTNGPAISGLRSNHGAAEHAAPPRSRDVLVCLLHQQSCRELGVPAGRPGIGAGLMRAHAQGRRAGAARLPSLSTRPEAGTGWVGVGGEGCACATPVTLKTILPPCWAGWGANDGPGPASVLTGTACAPPRHLPGRPAPAHWCVTAPPPAS